MSKKPRYGELKTQLAELTEAYHNAISRGVNFETALAKLDREHEQLKKDHEIIKRLFNIQASAYKYLEIVIEEYKEKVE
jgi:hypothetical protein